MKYTLIYISIATLIFIAFMGINQLVFGTEILDIKGQLSYLEVETMGFPTDSDMLNLNVENKYYAEYLNNGTAFNFIKFKPMESINDLGIPLSTAQNIPNPYNDFGLSEEKSEIEELKEKIEELKDDKDKKDNNDNSKDEDDKDESEQSEREESEPKDTNNENQTYVKDPRDAEKYDNIDWRDGENPENDMTLEEVEEHYNENQEQQPYYNNDEDSNNSESEESGPNNKESKENEE